MIVGDQLFGGEIIKAIGPIVIIETPWRGATYGDRASGRPRYHAYAKISVWSKLASASALSSLEKRVDKFIQEIFNDYIAPVA